MDFERSFDGIFGRMMSWLTLPPVGARREDGDSDLAADLERTGSAFVEQAEEVAAAVVEAVSEPVSEALEAAVERPAEVAAPAPAVAAEEAPDAGEAAAPEPASDPLESKILEALAVSGEGAAIRQLQRSTGGKPTTLRTRLNRLIAGGRVQRRGKGMRTRYHLVQEAGDD